MYQRVEFENYGPTMGDLAMMGYPLFDDTWDTYVTEYKPALCEKIKRYYWFNQIGAETPDRFRWFLNAELERKMPYYNQLYASQLIKFDPMLNYALKTQGRKIENLCRVANTDNTAIGKALRNFVNSANKDGTFDGNLTGKYGKDSERNIKDDLTKNEKERIIKEGTEDITDTKDITVNTEGTEDSTATGTKGVTGSGNESGTFSETKNTDGSKVQLYSDTPQKDLSKNSVRWDYLTNATHITTSEEMGDKIDTSREYSNKEDTSTKDILDKDTTGKETTDETDTRDRDYTEDITDTKDTAQNETTKDTYTEGQNTTEDTTQKTNEKTSENGKEDTFKVDESSARTDEKHTKDEGNNEFTSGYINISPADLLKAFRDTFINVDEMIIKDLRFLFMEVF